LGLTLDGVKQALTGIASFHAEAFHHDVAVLPNGHLILLINHPETINNVSGIPSGTVMLGDGLIDWDPQRGPVWTWSAFDHLDVTHAPYGLADWTHANAVIYSPDDGNLIVSMRNQNWIVKIDYRNGAGDGSVLWRFGPSGDFTLPGQQAPIEWNYGQHYPTILSANSSGVFTFMFFNNGNNRLMNSSNLICSSPGVGTCYSSVPVFQVDEFAKTATVLSEVFPSFYSICFGDASILPNGNTEFDVAFDITGPPNTSHIQEVTPTHDLVWQMDIHQQLAYRGLRIPSLYPGQVWPAVAQSDPAQNAAATARVRKAGASPTLPISRLP
jgi:arylsulfate sulfotransferase